MTPSARLSAAIAIWDQLTSIRVPLSQALKEWGARNRYAGAKDRAAISNLIYDAYRKKSSSQWLAGGETGRETFVGLLWQQSQKNMAWMEELFCGSQYAPQILSDAEKSILYQTDINDAQPWIRADVPEWLWPKWQSTFQENAEREGIAQTERAPLDLRVNLLQQSPENVCKSLSHLKIEVFSSNNCIIRINEKNKQINVIAEEAYQRGWIEIQDAGSQIAALCALPLEGDLVVDLCAGAGGKTLALAALLNEKQKLIATDNDRTRLAAIYQRLDRAKVQNVEVRAPRHRNEETLNDIKGKVDTVFVDAPCTGTGTWRRNPDAKWRLRQNSLNMRLQEQKDVLERAITLLKPGGRLVYVTCSVLAQENENQIKDIIRKHEHLECVAPANIMAASGVNLPADLWQDRQLGIQLTPALTSTDGFFISVLKARN